MAAIGVAVTWPAWANIYHIASKDEESSHVFLVPVVALWMLWARRVRFRYCKPTGTILGPILVGFGWAISSYGFYHGIQSFWHGGSVLVVLGCIVSVLGKHAILRFLPVVAPSSAVPIGTGRVSSGCIRLVNDDVMDLYGRVNVGTKVVVLPIERHADMRANAAR